MANPFYGVVALNGSARYQAIGGEHAMSWRNQLVLAALLAIIFNSAEPWESDTNRVPKVRTGGFDGEKEVVFPLTALHTFKVLQCPASPLGRDSSPPGTIHYVAIAGVGLDSPGLPIGHPRVGVFGYDRQTRLEDIKDGTANTMMVAETATGNGPWIAGGTATLRGLDPSHTPYVGRNRQFGGFHPDGAMVLFADGSVRLIKGSIASQVFEAYSTMAGSEQVIAPDADTEILPPYRER
jgi:prepilin-type processing-associated H-X9-DG protein